MMVPRVFAAQSPPRFGSSRVYDEKKSTAISERSISERTSRSPSPSRTTKTSPRPPDNALSVREKKNRLQLNSDSPPPQRPLQTPVQKLPKRDTAQDILSATAIPIRRKPKRRAVQRLPDGDHVANFSSWLQEDLKFSGTTLSSSYGGQFDGLFGSIDGCMDEHMFVGSEGLDAGILRTRSISTESMPSLASPHESSIVDSNASPSPFDSRSRSPSYRKIRQLASSEDCVSQHPLMIDEEEEDDADMTPELILSPTPKKARAEQSRRASTFKSTLTASLRAIKSAAQSVSNYATPFNEADMFSTPFDIRPSLTDDRRPPPDAGPPSPALRRYLNPNRSAPPDSPAQLHFWTEHRGSSPAHNAPRPKLPRRQKSPSDEPDTSKRAVAAATTSTNQIADTSHLHA
ncbi:uncharacterized protein AB675_4552 [Cyphellophora attinorum]|uniref:Uncharacterized protein n=1 Tax=Cyphellophora attinorum TaxID=1664694 RepID=A0A0N1H9P6_9EURO|nr:uncharacterized protein AB675_4552 [Phialophora attinorum]KPI38946.1 hypothetical protein AB675_4552 [Phialophora attinorum]